MMSMDSLCSPSEGWGSYSPSRHDLTLCFEYSIFYGVFSLSAILLFFAREFYFRRTRVPHNLGRSPWIYWPSQTAMFLASMVIIANALVLYLNDHAPVAIISCFSMGIAWLAAVVLNHDEHKYEIRSSTLIFMFYIETIASTLAILHTHYDSPNSDRIMPVNLLILFTIILSFGFVIEAWPRGSTRVQKASGASPYDKANIFSRLIFYHYQYVISIGLRRTITAQDIANILPVNNRTGPVYTNLALLWNKKLLKNKNRENYRPSLFWTAIRSHGLGLVPIVACRIAIIALSYTLPLFLDRLLGFLQDGNDKPLSYGIMLACGMFIVALSVALLYTYNRYQMFLLSVSTKAALISMIYRKALRLSPGARVKSTVGEITNHMAVDAEQWGDAMIYLSMWVSIPIEICVSLYFLYNFLGWSMMAGFLALLSFIPLQTWQAGMFKVSQMDSLKAMDQRVRLATEVLSGMRVVKLYGWTSAFLERILAARRKELKALRRLGIVQSFMSINYFSSPLIISLITFGVFSMWGGPNFTPGKLTPQTVFVSMTLFSMLRIPVSNLSEATTTTVIVMVGTKRIQEFLLSEEISENDVIRSKNTPQDPESPVILVNDATFSWTSPERIVLDRNFGENDPLLSGVDSAYNDIPDATLQSINLSILSGSLTAVVGRVGQGKSSLLSAIIGEMYKTHGEMQISGRIAYVPQQAWIFNATLKDNILFGNDYDEERYNQVVSACALEADLAILPAGDLTEIGERGINLSGGQKQRVSLARAAYANSDIYLLDDPLSAVDAHVDHHLWNNLIGPSGMLRNKTRILVTHGIHHLEEVDKVIVLKDGAIVEQGHYGELMENRLTFYQLIKEYSTRNASERKKRFQRRNSRLSHLSAASIDADQMKTDESAPKGLDASSSNLSTDDESEDLTETGDGIKIDGGDPQGILTDVKKDSKAELIAPESMKIGQVNLKISIIYFKAMSYAAFSGVVLLFIAAQACLVGSNLWLRYWIEKSEETDKNPNTPSPSIAMFLGVYGLITAIYVILHMSLPWLHYAVGRIRASEILHRDLIAKVMHLPMSFFDTTPLGRVLNRFSSDFASIDDKIPTKLFGALYFGASVISTFILIAYTTPNFIFVIPGLVLGYWMTQKSILRITSPLARIYSVSKSPVYQHFNETLNGVSTIRAMAVQENFIAESTIRMDYMANNFMANVSGKRWIEVQLRLLSTFVLLFASLFAVLGKDYLDPSLVGLTLSFALSITEEVTSLVRIYCDLQTQLISVERVIEYTDLKTEAPDHTDVYLPPKWPSRGHIQFRNYSTRYREGLDLVLKNISLDILPGESVGIVGRTGAGKSSLTLALFRIIEAANSYWAKASDNTKGGSEDGIMEGRSEGGQGQSLNHQDEDGGSIEIDGVDISAVGLEDLRKSLAIIPQEPTLFAGTVRMNLDPFQEMSDADLWEALERSHLKAYIQTLPGGLSFEVSQNGENFSVGQRSLICLARALLRKTKILIMDEATAAVDVETDELIQRTIQQEFKDRTVLTIAHRIKTVMNSDKILVLEKGRVQEFDSPNRLLKNRDSLFFKLAEQAGEI